MLKDDVTGMNPAVTELVLPCFNSGPCRKLTRSKKEMAFDCLEIPASTTGRRRRSGWYWFCLPSLMALPCLNAVAQRLNNSLSRASWRDTRVCFNRCTRRVSAGARRANVQPRSYWMWQRTIQLLSEEPRHEERSRIGHICLCRQLCNKRIYIWCIRRLPIQQRIHFKVLSLGFTAPCDSAPHYLPHQSVFSQWLFDVKMLLELYAHLQLISKPYCFLKEQRWRVCEHHVCMHVWMCVCVCSYWEYPSVRIFFKAAMSNNCLAPSGGRTRLCPSRPWTRPSFCSSCMKK